MELGWGWDGMWPKKDEHPIPPTPPGIPWQDTRNQWNTVEKALLSKNMGFSV